MINFRYHIVSIVAVFLALAIGIVMGTTVISESVVGRLEADARDFRARNGELRQEADRLEHELATFDRFGAAIVPPAIRGRLDARNVVLLIQDGASGSLVDHIVDALRTAGAHRPARLRLTAAWSLEDDTTRQRLAEALGGEIDAGDGPGLIARAAEKLGLRLAASGDPAAADDLIGALDRAGLLRLEDVASGAFPQERSLLVIVPAGTAGAVPDDAQFTVPMLRAVAESRTTAVAEAVDAQNSLADRIRGDESLSKTVATVDHADGWPGELSLVYALSRPASEPAPHYGVRRGARAIAPTLPLASP